MKLSENLNNFDKFEENCMEFDEEIAIKMDDPTSLQNNFKKGFESELFTDVTLITETDSTR